MDRNEFRHELAQQLRVDSVRVADAAGSGHPTSSMSAADVLAVLLDGHLRLDVADPHAPNNDQLVFSKGHASPLLYAALKAAGAITEEELLSYRKFGSRLQGHPTPALPWVPVATGSLGQGLPIGVGLAMTAKSLDRLPYRVFVLCGDSELAEGSIWEAFECAGHARLDNLCAIVDVNRLGQTGPSRHGWDLGAYSRRARAFGWEVIEIDGHDLTEIDAALTHAGAVAGRPLVILAKTRKGRGVAAVEDQPGKHGKPLPDKQSAIAELGGLRDLHVRMAKPDSAASPHQFAVTGDGRRPRYDIGAEVATRTAYGEALRALGDVRGDVVALDGEVSNSTKSELFRHAHPDRYFEMYIAEQQMIAAAVGMQVRGWRPFASTFAAFLTRAHDFLRMATISGADVCVVGSHAGVAIGEDGPSQMGLEDVAMFRALHGSFVLYPCDANQTVRLVEQMASLPGISYLRTNRGATPVIYSADQDFPIGGSRVLRTGDDVTLVGAGGTVHAALEAAQRLAGDGIDARVIDAYSVKPLDAQAMRTAARETSAIVTAEDHRPAGGLGEAVLSALAGEPDTVVRTLAVTGMPGSGTPAELLGEAGIDAAGITSATHDVLATRPAFATR